MRIRNSTLLSANASRILSMTDIEDVGGDRILLTRKDNGNVIFIDWWR